MLTLAEPLEHARQQYADRLALIDGERRMTYGELHERVQRLAAALRALGLGPGDRVAILAANGHHYFEAFFAVPIAGMILVPLNTRLALPELTAILADAGVRVLLCDRDPGPLARCVERAVELTDEYERLLSAALPMATELTALDENAVAALFYTGGTTGVPKGVMLTHRNLVSNAFHKTIACSITGDDVFLAAPAMFHVAGIAPLVGLVWMGACSVTLPAFDPERCLDAIARHGVTFAIPVPTMLGALVAAQRRDPHDMRSLRLLGHAGSPIAISQIAEAHAAFPNTELAQFYGATETASIVTSFRHEERALGTALIGSCGRATPGVALRIVREDDSACALGEVGEIQVRGPNITVGYWRNDVATAAAFSGSWYRSGDLGLLREGGYAFVVDRVKDMIVSGAENVYSIEVEDVLQRHPLVQEAAVFGMPDPTWGEAVHALVVVMPDAGDREQVVAQLKEHCRRFIAGYKVPKHIALQHEPLPKSGPGKVLKRAIRERYRRSAPEGST